MTWTTLKHKLSFLLSRRNKEYNYYFDPYDKNINSIICLTPAGIGDVIMQAPAIAALKAAYPESHLTILGHNNRNTPEVCRLMPSVDEVVDIGIPKYTWLSLLRYMLFRFWTLSYKLRKRRYDLVVSFIPNPVRKLFLFTVATKYWIYGNTTNGYPGKLSLAILDQLEIPSQERNDIFQIPEPLEKKMSFLNSCKRPVIGIHPFCGIPWRQWNYFESLVHNLSTLNATIVVFGKQPGYNIDANVNNLVNKLSIAELFWTINKCDAFITADSGPMHIAFSLNVPTVALFGVVKPSLRVPPNKKNRIRVLYKPSDISEKGSFAIPRKPLDNQAMQSITVDEVVGETMQLLNDIGWNI